jgi:arylformamidase
MSWRDYAADAERQFNPQANPEVDPKAEFALRSELSAAARERLQGELNVGYGPGPRQLLDIFPARKDGASIHVHIHGGYFRMGDKDSQSLFAEPFVAASSFCVFPKYDLCPQVSLDQLVVEVMDAIEWTHRNSARIGDPRRIYRSGSSAGAHLCAMAVAHDWTMRGLPPDFVTGATLLTGVYDLEPLLHISVTNWCD